MKKWLKLNDIVDIQFQFFFRIFVSLETIFLKTLPEVRNPGHENICKNH